MRNKTLARPAALPDETYSPRLRAIQHLRDLIEHGRAGLDPVDSTILILDVHPHEQVWARAAAELTGLYLGRVDDGYTGTTHYRMIVEADVRKQLGLDGRDAPIFGAGGGNVVALFDAADLADAERRLANPQTGLERAIADARDAQARMLERQAQ